MSHPIVHQAPPEWGTITGCCGRLQWDLPRPYRLTDDPTKVTCRGVPAKRVTAPPSLVDQAAAS